MPDEIDAYIVPVFWRDYEALLVVGLE